MPLRILTPAIALLTLILLACSTSGNGASLTLPQAPKTLSVGQTVSTAPATEKTRDLQGRLTANAQFRNYELTSGDTTIVNVVGTSVVGVKAGTTAITAYANDGSGLISGNYSITVQ